LKKILVPVLLALVGLGAGVGAGLALKPAPEPTGTASCAPPEGDAHETAAEMPCPPAEHDPFAPAAADTHGGGHGESDLAYVAMDKPFVVPVFSDGRVIAMVVVSLSVETDTEAAPTVEGVKPRLRDSFLKTMFRHANSGGFDGSFTAGPKMDDLKSALLEAARGILPGAPVDEVLITEIARQDV
jgi:flagellar FliL protein